MSKRRVCGWRTGVKCACLALTWAALVYMTSFVTLSHHLGHAVTRCNNTLCDRGRHLTWNVSTTPITTAKLNQSLKQHLDWNLWQWNNMTMTLDGSGRRMEEEEEERGEEESTLLPISGASERRLPQAIVIGVKKGGTRALLEFLRVHPDVRAAGPETHFFDKYYHRGLQWYRRQMPRTLQGQLTVEKTPSYFVTRLAPRRLREMQSVTSSTIRLIFVVRDPVTRAISDYTQVMSKRPNTPPFSELAFIGNTSKVDTRWGAISLGLYSRYLQRWLHYFPRDVIHIVSGERLISDPAGELARLQDFLGLKRLVTDKHFFFNETKGFPCLKKGEGSSGRPRCLGNTKGRPHPHVSDDVIRRLRAFYRPFNRKFYQLTGTDFGWP